MWGFARGNGAGLKMLGRGECLKCRPMRLSVIFGTLVICLGRRLTEAFDSAQEVCCQVAASRLQFTRHVRKILSQRGARCVFLRLLSIWLRRDQASQAQPKM